MRESKGTETRLCGHGKRSVGACGYSSLLSTTAHAKESQGYCGGEIQVMLDINAHGTNIFNTAFLTYAAL